MCPCHVAIQQIGLQGATKGTRQKGTKPPLDLRTQLGSSGHVGKEIIPDADGVPVEVRTVDDGKTESEEGVEQQGRHGQLIGLIVKPVLRSQICGKRTDSCQPWLRIQRITAGFDLSGQPGGQCPFGRLLQPVAGTGHQFFGKWQYRAIQLEQIADGIVVLEPIHPPDRGDGRR